jgi:hypothetical protein
MNNSDSDHNLSNEIYANEQHDLDHPNTDNQPITGHTEHEHDNMNSANPPHNVTNYEENKEDISKHIL